MSGFKTYMAAFAAMIAAVIAWLNEEQSLAVMIEIIGVAVSVVAVRFNVKEIQWLATLAELDSTRLQKIVADVTPFLAATVVVITAVISVMNNEQSWFTAAQAIIAAVTSLFLNRGVAKAELATEHAAHSGPLRR